MPEGPEHRYESYGPYDQRVGRMERVGRVESWRVGGEGFGEGAVGELAQPMLRVGTASVHANFAYLPHVVVAPAIFPPAIFLPCAVVTQPLSALSPPLPSFAELLALSA